MSSITEKLDEYILINQELMHLAKERKVLIERKNNLVESVANILRELVPASDSKDFTGIGYKNYYFNIREVGGGQKKKISVSADELLANGLELIQVEQLFDLKKKEPKIKTRITVKENTK